MKRWLLAALFLAVSVGYGQSYDSPKYRDLKMQRSVLGDSSGTPTTSGRAGRLFAKGNQGWWMLLPDGQVFQIKDTLWILQVIEDSSMLVYSSSGRIIRDSSGVLVNSLLEQSGNVTTVYGPLKVSGSTAYLGLPSLTTAERNALTAIAGYMIYNSSVDSVQVYYESAWHNLGEGGSSPGGVPDSAVVARRAWRGPDDSLFLPMEPYPDVGSGWHLYLGSNDTVGTEEGNKGVLGIYFGGGGDTMITSERYPLGIMPYAIDVDSIAVVTIGTACDVEAEVWYGTDPNGTGTEASSGNVWDLGREVLNVNFTVPASNAVWVTWSNLTDIPKRWLMVLYGRR
jgi:hypothetical protein